jgi:glycosyltransferase involved in cell wall biosynthesis
MKITLSAHRPFHFVQLANALVSPTASVRLYSSAPRKFFRGLDEAIDLRFTPSPILLASHAFPRLVNGRLLDLDTLLYDKSVAKLMPGTDIFFALATRALCSAQAAKLRGARFVLDRACPHVFVQQELLAREADRVEYRFRPQPKWLVDRQVEEYALADAILVPSEYTRNSFPPELRSKLILAPLLGRIAGEPGAERAANQTFTVGVIGNSPLRKGYLYLLRAWKKLALPNAQLLIRCAGGFAEYPVLRRLLVELPNVKLVPYISDLSAFYRGLDAFVLPSVDDGFGMAVFEALASGVPVIATRACGAAELLSNGVDSILVPPGREDALGEAIVRLYESKDLRYELGDAGAATAVRVQKSRVYETEIRDLVARLAQRD